MSLYVRVPVLSDRRYSTRPSYSGIELFLLTVPGILGSLAIFEEKNALLKSKLTLKLIGMMLARSNTYLK